MSTAWFRPHAKPELLRTFSRLSPENDRAAVQIWTTPCIVQKFGKPYFPRDDPPATTTTTTTVRAVLVNPSSPRLTGVCKFSYFPVGGPEPVHLPTKYEHHIMGYVTQWGDMRVANGMLFPANTVDGIVHEMAGPLLRYWEVPKLQFRQAWKRWMNKKGSPDSSLETLDTLVTCPVGQMVWTGPGRLKKQFDVLVHTVPPFYHHHEGPEKFLAACYQNSIRLAFARTGDEQPTQRLTYCCLPLLGAGGRGFPLNVAISTAARESVNWLKTTMESKEPLEDSWTRGEHILAFGIPQSETAQSLIACIEEELR